MDLILEIKREENTRDWETVKTTKPTKRNIHSYQRQAKKMIEKGVYQVHVVALTENDPIFQEFYYNDGTMFKMF